MPFELRHHRRFVADHFHDLPGFQEDRHGHNWEVEAGVRLADEGREAAFVASLEAWVKGVDYTLLNDQPWLAQRNPTAELLAQWAAEHLLEAGFDVTTVKVREKANYWALCRPTASSPTAAAANPSSGG
ncbi:MAG: 6-carboxytetrahydropterin synthase [Acidobacteria bacterium]|nr:6-carboxytetrahydropterin synthase [Acidobacteriota bacterium]